MLIGQWDAGLKPRILSGVTGRGRKIHGCLGLRVLRFPVNPGLLAAEEVTWQSSLIPMGTAGLRPPPHALPSPPAPYLFSSLRGPAYPRPGPGTLGSRTAVPGSVPRAGRISPNLSLSATVKGHARGVFTRPHFTGGPIFRSKSCCPGGPDFLQGLGGLPGINGTLVSPGVALAHPVRGNCSDACMNEGFP